MMKNIWTNLKLKIYNYLDNHPETLLIFLLIVSILAFIIGDII